MHSGNVQNKRQNMTACENMICNTDSDKPECSGKDVGCCSCKPDKPANKDAITRAVNLLERAIVKNCKIENKAAKSFDLAHSAIGDITQAILILNGWEGK
jgi:hypothetical protein